MKIIIFTQNSDRKWIQIQLVPGRILVRTWALEEGSSRREDTERRGWRGHPPCWRRASSRTGRGSQCTPAGTAPISLLRIRIGLDGHFQNPDSSVGVGSISRSLILLWCGLAQLVARRLAVRQARVRFSAPHHREVFPTGQTSDEEMDKGLSEWRWINVLYECDWMNESMYVS